VRFRLRQWGFNRNAQRSPSVFDHYLDLTLNGVTLPPRRWNNAWALTVDTVLTGLQVTNDAIDLELVAPRVHDPIATFDAQRVDKQLFAWYELYYYRKFVPIGNALDFESPPGGGSILYDIGPFTLPSGSVPRVFDVTDPLAPVEILGFEFLNERLRFQRTETGLRRYRVVPDDQIAKLPSTSIFMAKSSSTSNLRASPGGGLSGAQYVLIYYDGFQAAAESLAVWRRYRLPLHATPGPYQAVTIPVSALFDQFSGAAWTPVRSEASCARRSSTGIGADLRDAARGRLIRLQGHSRACAARPAGNADAVVREQLRPVRESPVLERRLDAERDRRAGAHSRLLRRTHPGRGCQLSSGIRAREAAPLRTRRAGRDWRNRVLLVADDNEQGAQIDGLGWYHIAQTAQLDTLIPLSMDRHYVYLHTYPDGPNETKPAAKADLIQTINGEGAVMWNYVGHGSPVQITDERIFLESDTGQLTNAARLTMFVAASCDVGKYNDPLVQSLGEKLVVNTGGGCIAVISATEVAFSNENAALNSEMYNQLFQRDPVAGSPTEGQFYISSAEALLDGKTGSRTDRSTR
jgi:hypothetical protein